MSNKHSNIKNELQEINEDLLQQGYSVQIFMKGTSMLPFFKPGDETVIKCTPLEKIKRGDILVIRNGNTYIAHRLIKFIEKENVKMILTKGDSCKTFDQPSNMTSIIAKVKLINRQGRTIEINDGYWKIINFSIARFPRLSHYLAAILS